MCANFCLDVEEMSENNYADPYEVVDIEQFHTFVFGEESDIFDMTSLGNFILLSEAESRTHINGTVNGNPECRRLSLAYEKLSRVPKIILQEFASHIKILDISNNEFSNLNFLAEFKELTTLICDHNNITSATYIPYLPNLELLWLNHCRIAELYPWAERLRHSCPNLKYLSLMGNPAAPSYLNGGNFYEYLQYRLFMISLFPNLLHLDDRMVTNDQVTEAQRLYKRPLLERLAARSSANLPECIRSMSEKVSDFLTPAPNFVETRQRNLIV